MTTIAQQALHKLTASCKDGHAWHSTIITGYFQCSHCPAIGACLICVPKASGKPKQGYCSKHQHLRTPETTQEVFA